MLKGKEKEEKKNNKKQTNRDLSGANCLAELASNASLLATRVAAKSVLATETRAQGPLFERVINGGRLSKKVAQRQTHAF